MYFNLKKKVGSMFLVVTLIVSVFASVPAFASGDNIEVVLTSSSATTSVAEHAKISVSIKGLDANTMVEAAQVYLTVPNSVEFVRANPLLKDSQGNPFDIVASQSGTKLTVGITTANYMTFADETPVFELVFKGEAGEAINLSVDNSQTYCLINGSKKYAVGESEFNGVIAESGAETKTATIKVKMDKVKNFQAAETGIIVNITDEQTKEITPITLSNQNKIEGSESSIAEFSITSTVLKEHTFTVDISGVGYIPYEKKNVTLNDVLIITNSDFVPGDITKDGLVNEQDKNAYENLIKSGGYNVAADFNRDGYVDEDDNVFGTTTAPEKTVPAKMSKPTVSGGDKQITVSWTAPDNGGSAITAYIIKYGTSSTNLNNTEEITSATTKTISSLSADTTYYVSVAAKNEIGTGSYSDVANAKTDEAGGGGGGGGAAAPTTPTTPTTPATGTTTPTTPSTNGEFTDLDNYAWASDSIYTLKNKGIISGISATEYAPANNIKRGDFILILTRMLNVTGSADTNFADVPESSYYFSAISAAKAAGIASGDGVNFMPENSITRQDLITLAYRAFLNLGYIEEASDTSSLDVFADKANISDYAKTAMASMVKAGIIQGSDGNVNPLGNATRAEVAVMCARLVALMN